MLIPGLTPRQEHEVADMLHRIGTVPHGIILPLFIDVDRAGVRATDPVRPSAEDVQDVAENIADRYHVPLTVGAFSFGLAIGLRGGLRFGYARRLEKQRRRIDEDYFRLDDADRAEIRRLIRILRNGGSLAVLTSDSRHKDTPSAQAEADTARQWARTMGQAARVLR